MVFSQKLKNMCISDIISKFSKDSNKLVYISAFDTPVGKTIAAADDDYLYLISFEDAKNLMKSFESLSAKLSCKYVKNKNKILLRFEDELADYFAGKLKKFNVPIRLFGSDFQNAVWHELLNVPFGSTVTYGDVAKALGGSTSHSRAVGAACGANPVPIVVPCHRIVATSAKGGGYSSGLDRKSNLLEHESRSGS